MSHRAQPHAQLAVLRLDHLAHPGALIALLGYVQRAADVVSELPLRSKRAIGSGTSRSCCWSGVFVYAFFKFSWSIRQFGFCSIVVGAVPSRPRIRRSAPVISRVSACWCHLRAAISIRVCVRTISPWQRCRGFLHPWLMIAITLWIVWVLYAREFRSRTLDVLGAGAWRSLQPGNLRASGARGIGDRPRFPARVQRL